MDMEQRLERIEGKLDKLSDAIVAIARTEEQVTSLFANHRALESRVDEHAKDIGRLRERAHDFGNAVVVVKENVAQCKESLEAFEEMKIDVHDNKKVVARIERITWALVLASISFFAYVIKDHLLG